MGARTLLTGFLMAALTAFVVWTMVDPSAVKRFTGNPATEQRAAR